MKKLIGLVVILAALVLGGYYGTGLMTERTLKRNVQIMNQTNGLSVEILQYDRSWFTANAKLHWQLHVPERVVKGPNDQSKVIPAQDFAIDMPLKIYHGPIIFADSSVHFGLGYAYTDLVLPPQYDQQFAAAFSPESTKPILNASVLVNYLNQSRFRIEVPAFKLITKEGNGQFEWLGFKNDVTISSNLSTVDGGLTVDGIKVIKDQVQTIIGKITTDYNLHQTKEGLYLGDASVSLPSFVIQNKGQSVFELSDFDVESRSDVQDGLFQSDFETSLNKLITGTKTYGPGTLKMSIKNLDANVLAQINRQVNQMQQSNDAQRQQAMIALLPQLPKLLGQGATFEVSELSFVTPEGKLEGNFSVSLTKGEMTNPFQLIQKLQGQGKVSLPTILVQRLMQQSAEQQLMQPNLQQAMVDQMQQAQAPSKQTEASQATPAATPAPIPDAATAPATAPDASSVAKAPDATTPVASTAQAESAAAAPATPVVVAPATMTPEQQMVLDQKAKAQADQKLASLVQSGLLVLEGDHYVVEFKLAEGQLTVNGQSFNPAAFKF